MPDVDFTVFFMGMLQFAGEGWPFLIGYSSSGPHSIKLKATKKNHFPSYFVGPTVIRTKINFCLHTNA